MTAVNDVGIPKIEFAILHPKLAHKWRIRFEHSDGSELVEAKPISKQATHTSPISRDKVTLIDAVTSDPFYLVVQDDVTNTAAEAVELMWNQRDFTILIEYLDGNDSVVRTIKMLECDLVGVSYSPLDYSANGLDAGDKTSETKLSTDNGTFQIVSQNQDGTESQVFKGQLKLNHRPVQGDCTIRLKFDFGKLAFA